MASAARGILIAIVGPGALMASAGPATLITTVGSGALTAPISAAPGTSRRRYRLPPISNPIGGCTPRRCCTK